DVDAELLEDGHDDSLVLAEEGEEEVSVVDLRVALATGDRYGLVDRLRGLHGETFRIDHRAFQADGCRSRRGGATLAIWWSNAGAAATGRPGSRTALVTPRQPPGTATPAPEASRRGRSAVCGMDGRASRMAGPACPGPPL